MANEIPIFRGDDKTLVVAISGTAGVTDITGWTIFFTAKTNETDLDADAVITKDVTSHSDPTNGTTLIALSNSDTDVTPRKYFYDIQAKDGSGQIQTFVKGILNVKQDITLRTS